MHRTNGASDQWCVGAVALDRWCLRILNSSQQFDLTMNLPCDINMTQIFNHFLMKIPEQSLQSQNLLSDFALRDIAISVAVRLH